MGLMPVFWLFTGLTASLVVVGYLIAADKTRFLARFDIGQWSESYYLRALPNFLQALHDNHFQSPWPYRRNAVSTAYFRFRAGQLLKKHPRDLRRAFLQQHITLFALLEVLRPYLVDFILNEHQRIVGNRIVEMEDTVERDRLVAYLESIRAHRAQFYGTLSNFDRQTLAVMIDRRMISTLRTIHAIFQEHGYALLPEFTQLRDWEQMTGTELVQELPSLPSLAIGRSQNISMHHSGSQPS